MAIDTLTGGGFQDSAGNKIALGSITFQLSTPALVTGTGQVVQDVPISYALDANGNIASGSTLWGNDQLTPAGTSYTVNILNANGALVRGPEVWVIAGTSPISLTSIVPASPSVSYSGAVLLTPTGSQEITEGDLTIDNNVVVGQTLSVTGSPNFTSGSFTHVNQFDPVGTFPFSSQIVLTNGAGGSGCDTAFGLSVPNTSTIITTAPIMSMANSSSTTSLVCGAYFNSIAITDGSKVWGLNALAQDTVATSAAVVQGAEIDVNVLGTPTLVRGLLIAGNSTGTMPASSGNAIQITMGGGTLWNRGVVIQNVASSGVGIVVQAPLTATAFANSAPAPIQLTASEWTGSAAAQSTWQIAQVIAASGAPTTDTLAITNSGSQASASQVAVTVPNLGVTSKLTSYNGSPTTNNGVAVEFASVALTVQAAALTNHALFTTAGAGQYRITFYSKVTRVDTTSSILGGSTGFTVAFTDQFDNTASTVVVASGGTNAGNLLTSGATSSVFINAAAATAVTFSYGYTSPGVTKMQYYIEVLVEAC